MIKGQVLARRTTFCFLIVNIYFTYWSFVDFLMSFFALVSLILYTHIIHFIVEAFQCRSNDVLIYVHSAK